MLQAQEPIYRKFYGFGVRRSTLALLICIPIPALADVVYGAMVSLFETQPISPGLILRGGLVVFILATALFKFARLGRGFAILISLIVAATLPALAVSIASGAPFVDDAGHLVKAIFMPLMLGFLAYEIDRHRIKEKTVLRVVELWTYVMTLGFVVPSALGVSVQTYGDYAVGEKGFFVAGNDSSLALSLGLFVVAYHLFFIKFSAVRFLMFLLGIYAVVAVGSRTGLILTAGAGIVVFLAVVFFRGRETRVSIRSKLGRGVATIALVCATAYAASYGLALQSGYSYQQDKLDELTSGAHPRERLIQIASRHLERREGWKNFTGEGGYNYETGVGQYWYFASQKIAEVDWLDAYGIYGLPFTLLIHALILFVVGVAIKNMIYFKSGLSFILTGASISYMLHSALAGHALFSPSVSTMFAVSGALILNDRQFRRMALETQRVSLLTLHPASS